MTYPLSQAPLTGMAAQGRFNPLGGTPDGTYGAGSGNVYGRLPCALLIAEMRGPSALAVDKTGAVMFRDTKHLGRWIEVDRQTGLCLVGGRNSRTSNEVVDYRTVRWLDQAGALQHEWTLPAGVPGNVYGLRVCGDTMAINTHDARTWLFELSGGLPTGVYSEFTAFNGIARSLSLKDGLLWIAATETPTHIGGGKGSLRAYNVGDGQLVHEYPGHYVNDLDFLPGGEVIWADEHLDRLRAVDPATGNVGTVMAGTASRASFDWVESMASNMERQVTMDGSGLCAGAVEYRGLNGLYAPNGVAVITEGLLAVADTDNSRVIVAKVRDGWEPEVIGAIALLNEPTKVRVIPQ